jgi:hypothetical protein
LPPVAELGAQGALGGLAGHGGDLDGRRVRPPTANWLISARASSRGGPGCGLPVLSWTAAMTGKVPQGAAGRAALGVACACSRGSGWRCAA